MLKQHLNDRLPQQNQPHRRGNRDERNDPQRKAEGVLHFVKFSGGRLMRHRRQKRRGHRDRVAPQHQLHHAVRDVERRNAARRHARRRGENRVHEQIDLINAHAEKARPHQPSDFPHARIAKAKATRPESHSPPNQRRNLHRQLNRASRPESRTPAPRPASGKRPGAQRSIGRYTTPNENAMKVRLKKIGVDAGSRENVKAVQDRRRHRRQRQ